jgi:1,4-dihydroxy-2-naphthoyl-CoA synthase
MSQPSTIRLERTTPRTARITFANPPANLVIPETIVTLHDIVAGLEADPDIQVVVFSSEVPTSSSTTSTAPPPATSRHRRARAMPRSGPTWSCA